MKKFFILALFTLLSSSTLFAADPPGFGSSGPGSPDPIPVDGGVTLLAVAGVAYGLRRLSKKKAEAEPA